MTDFQKDREVIGFATPGPWKWTFAGKLPLGDGFLLLDTKYQWIIDAGQQDDGNDEMVYCRNEDREFIARARSRWPIALDRIAKLEAAIEDLYDAIAHGDGQHRDWLKDAIEKHFAAVLDSEPT